jgi:hypothetical protein
MRLAFSETLQSIGDKLLQLTSHGAGVHLGGVRGMALLPRSNSPLSISAVSIRLLSFIEQGTTGGPDGQA